MYELNFNAETTFILQTIRLGKKQSEYEYIYIAKKIHIWKKYCTLELFSFKVIDK